MPPPGGKSWSSLAWSERISFSSLRVPVSRRRSRMRASRPSGVMNAPAAEFLPSARTIVSLKAIWFCPAGPVAGMGSSPPALPLASAITCRYRSTYERVSRTWSFRSANRCSPATLRNVSGVSRAWGLAARRSMPSGRMPDRRLSTSRSVRMVSLDSS